MDLGRICGDDWGERRGCTSGASVGSRGHCPVRVGDEGAERERGASSGVASVSEVLECKERPVVAEVLLDVAGWLAILLVGRGGGWNGGGVGEMVDGREAVVACVVPATDTRVKQTITFGKLSFSSTQYNVKA